MRGQMAEDGALAGRALKRESRLYRWQTSVFLSTLHLSERSIIVETPITQATEAYRARFAARAPRDEPQQRQLQQGPAIPGRPAMSAGSAGTDDSLLEGNPRYSKASPERPGVPCALHASASIREPGVAREDRGCRPACPALFGAAARRLRCRYRPSSPASTAATSAHASLGAADPRPQPWGLWVRGPGAGQDDRGAGGAQVHRARARGGSGAEPAAGHAGLRRAFRRWLQRTWPHPPAPPRSTSTSMWSGR